MVSKKSKKGSDEVRIPETGLLSLVATKLKGRILFPKKLEEAKKLLELGKKDNSKAASK